MLDNEVGPAFFFNMVDPAGNWTGWVEESVREIMTDFFAEGPIVPIERARLDRYVADIWPEVLRHLAA